MLTLFALSAILMQDPPSPPASGDEVRSSVFMVNGAGHVALDKDGDRQISREEFAAPLNDHFVRLDKDGDGRLSTDELAAGHGGDAHEIMLRHGAGGPNVHHFEMRRPMSGAGGDVIIQRGEGGEVSRVFRFDLGGGAAGGDHSVMLRERADGPGERRVIHQLRRDGDTSAPRVRIVELDGPGGADRSLDADDDGRLSEAEFTAPLREAFARMDADRSGFVEEGERGDNGEVRVFRHRIETRGNAED